jgi:hypothetical protein
VLAYLARYTHRVTISSRRLIRADANAVTFKYKDYRVDGPGPTRAKDIVGFVSTASALKHQLPTDGMLRGPRASVQVWCEMQACFLAQEIGNDADAGIAKHLNASSLVLRVRVD